jgi:hypothetical protein
MKFSPTFALSRIVLGLVLPGLLATISLSPVASAQVATPPPVSGRPLSAPEDILPADVLARVTLLRANVDILRRYMGRSKPPPPLLQGTNARPGEVYSQALNLELRANRLVFEQVRVVRKETLAGRGEIRPVDVFAVADSALRSILLVKQDMHIVTPVGEVVQPSSTTPTDVFNAVVVAGSEINNLLQRMTSPSDAFLLVTATTHTAATLHATIPGGGYLPEEPGFEPDKMPIDVLLRMRKCYEMASLIANARGLNPLQLKIMDDLEANVTPNDVSDMAALLLEELQDMHTLFPEAREAIRAYYPGKRFPAHVYQRAGLLEAILQDLVEAYVDETAPAGS